MPGLPPESTPMLSLMYSIIIVTCGYRQEDGLYSNAGKSCLPALLRDGLEVLLVSGGI